MNELRRRVAAAMLAMAALAAVPSWAHAAGPARVAVSPVIVIDVPGVGAEAAHGLDDLVAARLRHHGLDVVGAGQVRALRRELSDALGGAYDARTGAPVGDRPDTLRARLRRELAARHGATLWLRPVLREQVVRFSGDRVRWEGLEESTGGTGGAAGFLFGRTEGRLPVLAFFALLEDAAADTTWIAAGGIRLARHVVRNKPVRVPADSLLADPARTARAVERAVDGVVASLRRLEAGR